MDVLRFRQTDGMIYADVHYLKTQNIPLFQVDVFVLPNVAEGVVRVINQQEFFSAVSYSHITDCIPLKFLLYPCVIAQDFSPNVKDSSFLVIPCSSVCDYD